MSLVWYVVHMQNVQPMRVYQRRPSSFVVATPRNERRTSGFCRGGAAGRLECLRARSSNEVPRFLLKFFIGLGRGGKQTEAAGGEQPTNLGQMPKPRPKREHIFRRFSCAAGVDRVVFSKIRIISIKYHSCTGKMSQTSISNHIFTFHK